MLYTDGIELKGRQKQQCYTKTLPKVVIIKITIYIFIYIGFPVSRGIIQAPARVVHTFLEVNTIQVSKGPCRHVIT